MSIRMQTTMMRTAIAVLVSTVALAACDSPTEGGGEEPPAAVAVVEVQVPTGGVEVGQAVQLRAVVRGAAGQVLDRTPSWASSDTTRATITPAGLLTARSYGPVVVTASAEGRSGTVSFSIRQAAPALQQLVPASAATGDAGFELAVLGSGFGAGATVLWNGVPRATRVISASELRVNIPATDLQTPGLAAVVVANPATGGTVDSPRLYFMVTQGVVKPVLVQLAPGTVTSGAAAFELTVLGTAFTAGAVVHWNGQPRQTRVVSSTELRADITAADVRNSGTYAVTVANPAPGGAFVSAPMAFQVTPAQVRTFALLGLQDGSALPVEVSRTPWIDGDGIAHPAVQRVIAGALRLVDGPQVTRWELVVTIASFRLDTGAEVRRDEPQWWGTFMYDVWTGQPVLNVELFPGMRIRAEHVDGGLVLFQSLHPSGAAEYERPWLYLRH